ncbi:B12-binding domain-containing radical SAM protein [Candidatus Woesearchaeota archaeon]|nr:B12-binding domain-containing radical SAM protein [Candidatus Woesearchaeota archaeon]
MKKINIVLINPPVNYREHDALPPLGLLNLASMVREHNVKILDCVNKNIKPDRILRYISPDTDIIGISCNYTNNANNVLKIARILKKHRRAVIFSGGTHATFDYENLLSNGIDYIVMHEGEETFSELVRTISAKKPKNPKIRTIKGISYIENGKVVVNPDRPLIDMDKLPMPAWDLINEHDYRTSYGLESAIETGRGCSFNCSYCVSCRMWKHKHRYKSAERIAAEFMDAQKRGVKILHLYADENFTAEPKIIIDICERLIAQHSRVAWVCGGRADSIAKHPNMLHHMKKAGCIMLGLGYETHNNSILRSYCKTTTEQINQKASMLIKKSGLISEGGFIFGSEKETLTTILRTLLFSLQLDFANYSILRPYPGTKYWDEKYRPHLDRLNSSVSLLHRQPWMIEWAQKIATLIFYFHPKTVIKMFIGRPYQKYIARRWYAKIFSIGFYELKSLVKA